MAIADRNLTVGTKLWARYKGETYTAEVVEGDLGLNYRLADGRQFTSPSAAATAITGKAANGWAFWSTGEPTEKPARSSVHPAPKPERKARARKPKTETPTDGNGHTLPIIERLDDRFECGECGRVFTTREEASEHVAVSHPA